MAVINAWDFPGSAGDYAVLPTGMGHFRTDTGYNPWTVIVVGNVDNPALTTRGCWFASKRVDTDEVNHAIVHEPVNDNHEYQYNASPIHELTTGIETTANVWIGLVLSYAGGTGNVTLRRIPLSTATQSHSSTGAAGGTAFSDSQTQEYSMGGYESGGTTQQLLDGQIALLLVLKGTELSQANCESFIADPLNYGDSLTSTYGTNCFFWDDSGTDSGANGLAAPTLNGGVTRGTGNGPDIPVRSAGGSAFPRMFYQYNLGRALIR